MLQREEELQEEAAVEIHRARDVAEQDEPHLALLAPPVAQLDDLAPRQIRPQRAPQVHAAAPPDRPAPPADPTRQPAGDLHRQAQDFLELLGAEGREIARGQRLLLGRRRHAEGVAALLFFFLRAPALERQPLTARALAVDRRIRHVLRDLRPGERLAERIGLDLRAPEALEAAIEDRPLLRARHEQGPQPEVDLLAVAEIEMIERPHRLERLQWADRQGLASEKCCETGHGVNERASRH